MLDSTWFRIVEWGCLSYFYIYCFLGLYVFNYLFLILVYTYFSMHTNLIVMCTEPTFAAHANPLKYARKPT